MKDKDKDEDEDEDKVSLLSDLLYRTKNEQQLIDVLDKFNIAPDMKIDNKTLLVHAILSKLKLFATALLKKGANPNLVSVEKAPLYFAAFYDRTIASSLLHYGANVNTQDPANGKTCLHLLAEKFPLDPFDEDIQETNEFLKTVLACHPNVTLCDEQGVSVSEAISKNRALKALFDETYNQYGMEKDRYLSIFKKLPYLNQTMPALPLDVRNVILQFSHAISVPSYVPTYAMLTYSQPFNSAGTSPSDDLLNQSLCKLKLTSR